MIRRLNYLNGIILCTFGASGISVNREVAKNDMRLRASKFAGMSIAVSLMVSNKWKRLICHEHADYISITRVEFTYMQDVVSHYYVYAPAFICEC